MQNMFVMEFIYLFFLMEILSCAATLMNLNVHHNWGHYTKWGKPAAKDKYWMIPLIDSKGVKPLETEGEMVARAGGGGKRGVVV